MPKQHDILTTIPFQGFYNSVHGALIDNELQTAFDYDDSGNYNVPDDVYFQVDFAKIHTEYAKLYLENFAFQFKEETGIDLRAKFDELNSPREYNFSTDRIFARISKRTVLKLWKASKADNHKTLREFVKDRFTSYDGFASFYSPHLSSEGEGRIFGRGWPDDVLEWDHNQIGTLLEAVLYIDDTPNYRGKNSRIDSAFDPYDLMESDRGNGVIGNLVWDAMPEELREFADYQREQGRECDIDEWREGRLPLPRCKKTLELPLE